MRFPTATQTRSLLSDLVEHLAELDAILELLEADGRPGTPIVLLAGDLAAMLAKLPRHRTRLALLAARLLATTPRR